MTPLGHFENREEKIDILSTQLLLKSLFLDRFWCPGILAAIF
jgi:hypothetical protein